MNKMELISWLEEQGFKPYDHSDGIVRLWKGDLCVSIFKDGKARACDLGYELPSLTVIYCNEWEYEQIERWVNRITYYRSQNQEKSEGK